MLEHFMYPGRGNLSDMNHTYFWIILFSLLFPVFSVAQNKDLDYFVGKSLSNDPKISEFQNQILANRIDSQLLVATGKLQITGNGNAYYAPIINGYGYDMAITNGQQLSALVAFSKTIYNKSNLSLQFKNLQLQNDSLANSSSIYSHDVKTSVISQYVLTYGDQLQLNFNDTLISILTREEQLLKDLVRRNVYRQADYLAFLVTLQQQKLTRDQLSLQYKNNYATLNYMAGLVDTLIVPLVPPPIHLEGLGEPGNSPLFANYRIDSLRIQNERLIAKMQYRPKVNLFADAGYQSTFILTPYKNFGTNVGFNLTIPIYDGHQKKLQFSKLDIEERTRQKRQDFFYSQYRQRIEQLQQQLGDLESLAGPVNRQIGFLEALLRVNGKLLETGDIKIADYILALNNYITAKNMVVQNRISKYLVIQQLNYWNMKL